MRPLPGPVAALCGLTVEDFTQIGPSEQAPYLQWGNDTQHSIAAIGFNDILHVGSSDAEVLASYAGGYYRGTPALVRNQHGKGSTYYYGAVFSLEAAIALIDQLGLQSPVREWLELAEPIELCIRAHPATGEQLTFLLNYSAEPQSITLHQEATDILSSKNISMAALCLKAMVCVFLSSRMYQKGAKRCWYCFANEAEQKQHQQSLIFLISCRMENHTVHSPIKETT